MEKVLELTRNQKSDELSLSNLSFCKIKAYYRAVDLFEFPNNTGSTFRGALGHALKKIHFHENKKTCRECTIQNECKKFNLYEYLFESPSHNALVAEGAASIPLRNKIYPQPFILDSPPGGLYQTGCFITLPVTLVGKAIRFFPFLACALNRMSKGRLGQYTDCIRLEGIVDDIPSETGLENMIYEGKTGMVTGSPKVLDFHIVDSLLRKQFSDTFQNSVHLRFLSPFRFKKDNFLSSDFSFETFMRNVFRRLTLLSVHSPLTNEIDYKRLLEMARTIRVETSILSWSEWQRYSARQKSTMRFGGVIGEIIFSGPVNEFLPFIKMCEYVNVGKGGSFGLGKYEMIL